MAIAIDWSIVTSSSRVIGARVAVPTVLVMAAGMALFAPTAANAATTTLTLDCDTVPYSSQDMYVAPGDTYTFNLTGFDTVYDYNTASDIDTLDPTGDVYVVGAGESLEFYDNSGTCGNYFDVDVEEAAAETVPSGALLFTQDISIPVGASQITVDETAGGEHFLGGLPECGLSTDIHGQHVYGTLNVTVLTTGTFTFRGLISSPAGYYSPLQPYDPIGDPFLAVYQNFDPTQPDTGVVGCNDDLNDVGASNDAELLSDGSILEGHQPYFSTTLTPGNYTLVLATWEDLSTDNLAAGYGPWEDDNFTIGTKSTRFQLWGPLGSLSLSPAVSTPPAAALAATGTDTEPAVLGGTLLLGGLVISVAGLLMRRRHRTA